MFRSLLFAIVTVQTVVVFCDAANQLPPPPGPADRGFNRLRGYETVTPSSTPTSTSLSSGLENGSGSEDGQAARAGKADIAGILKTVSLDEDGDDLDRSFMIVINEYVGREIVRQSVGYQTLSRVPSGMAIYHMTRCFDISDYGVIDGELSFEQFHRLFQYLEDTFKKADDIWQTMTAIHKYPYLSRLMVTLESTAWTSLSIELNSKDWECREIERESGKRECRWTPGPTVSNSIRPYHFTEAIQIVKADWFYDIYSDGDGRQVKL